MYEDTTGKKKRKPSNNTEGDHEQTLVVVLPAKLEAEVDTMITRRLGTSETKPTPGRPCVVETVLGGLMEGAEFRERVVLFAGAIPYDIAKGVLVKQNASSKSNRRT